MLKSFFYLVLIINLIACSSAKLTVYDQNKSKNLRSLAIVPVDYPSDIQREKVDAIVSSIESELRNSGHIVLADKLVRENCSTPACPERAKLAAKFPVDGFVSVDLDSVTRANFIAGFYNAIKGSLKVSDQTSSPILDISHTESERGGLLFNTGQIFQALISYSRNTEKDSLNKLSTGFAQALVSKIPKYGTSAPNLDATAVSISDVKVKQVRPEIFEVCVDATPDSLVSVVVNRLRTNLRFVGGQKYCGSFLYNQNFSGASTINVEARSPFGDSVRKQVPITQDIEVCNLGDNVLISDKGGKPTIELSCLDLSGKSNPPGCKEKISCPNHKFIVFRAPSNLGPYEKVAEFKSGSWTDSNLKKGMKAFYELVTVNKSGVWSLPVAPRTPVKEGEA